MQTIQDATLACAARWSVLAITLVVILLVPLPARAAFGAQTATAATFLQARELTLATIVLIETVLVVALLVTRRRSEPAQGAHELSRRLILAQEEERRRIARELHDHLNQRLALLAIDLQQLAMSDASAALAARLDELWQRTTEISSEVHGLSHRLHPSKLEALGLVATIRGHCRDMSRQGVVAHFVEDAAPSGIPADVSLCLFRVVEAALSNVVRHSEATEAYVTLEEVNRDIVLRVADSGRGFVHAAKPDQAGLGLVSMRERLRSVGGTLKIDSALGHGSIIEARIPREAMVPSLVEVDAAAALRTMGLVH